MKLINGDCIEVMRSLPDKSIDLIVTDPPYFLPATHYQTRKQFSRNFADLGILEHFYRDVFRECGRLTKKVIYCFCDGQSYPLFYYHLYPFCKSIRPLIWDKKTSINGYSWRHQHEFIIFAELESAPIVPSGDSDILRFSAVKVENRVHPAEKPRELIEALVEKSSQPNDVVLDPFMGSGTTGVVCKELGREFIGVELAKEYFDIAERRINMSHGAHW